MSDPASTIDCLVARARRLHTLPGVAMEVLELTKNPRVDARALKTCIENDPALTTKLLRVVNSSLFGLGREVSDLNQALALLGTKPLKLLVLGFSLPPGLFAGIAGKTLEWYWRRTLTKAVAGREISETIWNLSGDDPFIVGLLQDLGMLLLIQELGEPYLRLLEKTRAGGVNLIAVESESMGFDHTMLSSRLLAHWGLPEVLVDSVCWKTVHEQIRSLPPSQRALPQILHLAELVARLLADGDSDVLGELLAVGQQYHGVSEQQLDQLVGDMEDKVRGLADVFSLQLPDGLDYPDLLARAHEQLADVAVSAAGDLIACQADGSAQPAAAGFGSESLLEGLQSLSEAITQVSERSVESAGASQAAASGWGSAHDEPVPIAVSGPAARAPTASGVVGDNGLASAGIDPGTAGRLAAAVAACRGSRCPLSLLLVEFDGVDKLMLTHGVQGLEGLRRFLEAASSSLDHRPAICLPHGEAGSAVILPDCDRQRAIQLGNRLIDSVRQLAASRSGDGRATIGVSVGVATVALPPKNFLPGDLLDGADRCLYGSHASGGGVVKSIEIY